MTNTMITTTNTTANSANRTYKDIKTILEKAKNSNSWSEYVNTLNEIPFIFCGIGTNPIFKHDILYIAILPPTKQGKHGYEKDLKTFKKMYHLFCNIHTYFTKRIEYDVRYTNTPKQVILPYGLDGKKSTYYNNFKDMLCKYYKNFDVADIILYGAIQEKDPETVHIMQWNKTDVLDSISYNTFLQENAIIDTDKRGFYCLRVRPNKTAVNEMPQKVGYTCSIPYKDIQQAFKQIENATNFGEKFEGVFYEKYTDKKWQKSEEKSFKYVPDLYINGKGYQFKFGRATLCRVGTLKDEL